MKALTACILKISVFLMICNSSALADIYLFSGQQKVGLAGFSECYVEVEDQGSSVTVRALTQHPHAAPQTALALGPISADYNSAGYYRFLTNDNTAPVKEMILFAKTATGAERYAARFFHSGHYDPVNCDRLQTVEDETQWDFVSDLFANFENIKSSGVLAASEDDHDHDEDHADHDHH